MSAYSISSSTLSGGRTLVECGNEVSGIETRSPVVEECREKTQ
jgi:hypothetical protein